MTGLVAEEGRHERGRGRGYDREIALEWWERKVGGGERRRKREVVTGYLRRRKLRAQRRSEPCRPTVASRQLHVMSSLCCTLLLAIICASIYHSHTQQREDSLLLDVSHIPILIVFKQLSSVINRYNGWRCTVSRGQLGWHPTCTWCSATPPHPAPSETLQHTATVPSPTLALCILYDLRQHPTFASRLEWAHESATNVLSPRVIITCHVLVVPM